MKTEIEDAETVTPAMIDAGVDILREWQESDEWDYRKFIERLYIAMHNVANLTSSSPTPDQSANQR